MTEAIETLSAQFALLESALNDSNEALAQSIISEIRPIVGTGYLSIILQGYILSKQNELDEKQVDIVLDILRPLMMDAKTEEDANYVAPNLSPEVADLLVYMSSDIVKGAILGSSPNWTMVPTSLWEGLLKRTKAAVDRHAA